MNKVSIIETLSKYVNGTGNQIHSFSENPIEVTHLGNLQNYEKPDGYYVAENTLYILEHFEFDSTKSTKRKGSETRRDNDRIERRFNTVSPTDEGVVLRDSMNVQHSSKHYMENALQNMENHYNKINSYIENLNDNGVTQEKIKIGFLLKIQLY